MLLLMGAIIGNGWSSNGAQQGLLLFLFVYALVCLASVVNIFGAAISHRPGLTLIMSISQAVPALIFYLVLLGPGEIRLGFLPMVGLLTMWVSPFIFGCIWAFTRKRGRAAQR